MATSGTAMQGLSAAIVIQAINLISDFAYKADERMNRALDPSIYQHISDLPAKPLSVAARRADSLREADAAFAPARQLIAESEHSLAGKDMPPFVESAVADFFKNYLSFVDKHFPGLRSAAASADSLVGSAFGPQGLTTNEVIDAVGADAAFVWDQQDAFAQERVLLDARAAAGHRFLPGVAFNAIGRMHAAAIRPAAAAAAQVHAARAATERKARMDLARAATAQRVDQLRKITDQAAEAFKQKVRARGLHQADRMDVVGTTASFIALDNDFQTRLAGLALEAADRHHSSTVAAGRASDRSVDIAKANYTNGQELVDLLGNMVTTLFNQVRASGSYTGTERDVTDWDSILT